MAALMLTLTLMTLTGCRARVEMGVTVRSDGSGEVVLAEGIDEELRRAIVDRGADPEAQVEAVVGDAGPDAPAGTREEPWDEDGFTGRRFVTSFSRLADLEGYFDDPGGTMVRTTHDGALGIEFDLARFSDLLLGGIRQHLPDDALRHLDLRFSLRLPGPISEHNADRVEPDGELVWDLLSPTTPIARARAGLDPGSPRRIPVALLALVAVPTCALARRRRRSRKGSTPQPAKSQAG